MQNTNNEPFTAGILEWYIQVLAQQKKFLCLVIGGKISAINPKLDV
jgi:hypothetical protein